jgi:hypothetical protein
MSKKAYASLRIWRSVKLCGCELRGSSEIVCDRQRLVGAQIIEYLICHRDDIIPARDALQLRPNHVIDAVNHRRCLVEQLKFVDSLNLAGVERDLYPIDDAEWGVLKREARRRRRAIDANRRIGDVGVAQRPDHVLGIFCHHTEGRGIVPCMRVEARGRRAWIVDHLLLLIARGIALYGAVQGLGRAAVSNLAQRFASTSGEAAAIGRCENGRQQRIGPAFKVEWETDGFGILKVLRQLANAYQYPLAKPMRGYRCLETAAISSTFRSSAAQRQPQLRGDRQPWRRSVAEGEFRPEDDGLGHSRYRSWPERQCRVNPSSRAGGRVLAKTDRTIRP